MAKKYKLDKTSAQAEFDKFAEMYNIDPEYLPEGSDSQQAMLQSCAKMIDAIRLGYFEFIECDEGVKVKQNLRFPQGDITSIEYTVMTGKHKRALDSVTGKNAVYARVFALLGSLSGLGTTPFTQLKAVDYKNAELLGYFFLEG